MSARVLAAFCLFDLVVCSAPASSNRTSDSEVLVYLSGDAAQPHAPLDAMKPELRRLMDSAGYRVIFTDSQAPVASTDFELVVVTLRGRCGMPAMGPSPRALPTSGAPLASTAVEEGRILPFSSVDCAGLSAMLSAPLSSEPAARRDFLYGRAMARLIAHELYHVLLQTRGHERTGIARPGFSASDLLTDRFAFEAATTARLRPAAPEFLKTPAEERTALPEAPSLPETLRR